MNTPSSPHQHAIQRDVTKIYDLTDPYVVLAAAFLQRVVNDANGRLGPYSIMKETEKWHHQQTAHDFLGDDQSIDFWASVAGVEGTWLRTVLRRATREQEG